MGYFGLYDTLKPMFLGADAGFLASFLLGWMVTVVSALATHPIDTIRRRMMMTSGTGVHYKSSIDCGMQILKNEGFKSLMKGAGADILFCVSWLVFAPLLVGGVYGIAIPYTPKRPE